MSPDALSALLRAKTLLIFDFDGTLVDSSPLHARAFNTAFERWSVRVDYPTIAGLTTEAAVDRIANAHVRNMNADDRVAVVNNKRAIVARLIRDELVAIDGAVEFVEAAAARFKLALCTSGSRPTVTVALARVGLTGCFHPIVAAGDVASKPDPEGFLRVLAQHAVPAADALIFEDSASGLAAAAAAGIEALCIFDAGHGGDAPGPCLASTTWPPLTAALAA